MELPCKKLHCELLERLGKGLQPTEFTMTIDEMNDKASELINWFTDHDIQPKDAIGIMKILEMSCWEAIFKGN